MNIWAIIPVKAFAIGKSRLAGILGPAERAELNRRLFLHVFEIAIAQFGAHRVAVVTADDSLPAMVRKHHANLVHEPPAGSLNAALAQASTHASASGADAIVVLPCDLPLLEAADIAALIAALSAAPCCAIAPDAIDDGTNALALVPPAPDFFRFGPQSFAAHLKASRDRGMEPRIVLRPGLARDLDTADDYRQLAAMQWPGARSVVCAN